LGCGVGVWTAAGIGPEGKRNGGWGRKGFPIFLKHPNQMNSNKSLNSNTQKQCTSMYATVNSNISLFN
jgi:hypothetical protein